MNDENNDLVKFVKFVNITREKWDALEEKEIERSSGTNEYLSTGTLYQSIIPLKIEGAVEVSYTPVKLRRAARKVEIE